MLVVHRAERADALVDALAELLSAPLPDPFAPEVVAVPTHGMERWLTQRLSAALGARSGRADGVCANVEFPSPHRLVSDAIATASGIDPDRDPWLPERSVWPLVQIVGDALHEPWLATLARYLDPARDPPSPARQNRRLTAMRHLASLFHRYALHRPQMLAAWARGEDADATGRPLEPGCAWQAELWRRLRARLAAADPAERRSGACRRLIEDPGLVELPERLSLFGLTRLPAGQLEILRALAQRRDLHLFLLHPSPGLWAKVAAARPAAASSVFPGAAAAPATPASPPGTANVIPRAADPTAHLPANRLLASWGRDAREMQVVLTSGATEPADRHHPSAHSTEPQTLLARLQEAIRTDHPPPGAPLPGEDDLRPALAAEDHSIQVHSCHGRARQVEVVRDAILHALAEDQTLEPRDVIVMCPDIETFAPLIQATFGAGETLAAEPGDQSAQHNGGHNGGSPPPSPQDQSIDLRVRLADRSLRQTNPVLAVVSLLLELAEQRVTASQVLDLADRAPVRRRFRLDDDDITRLQDWISQAGIRWGLDAAHRAPYKLDTLDHGTWDAGLQRVLLGVTMTEDDDRLFSGVLPLDDVDSRSIDLAGRFAELVSRLHDAITALSVPQSPGDWAHAIAHAADSLTATSPRDRWQRAELARVLDEMATEAADAADGELELSPAEMRAFLADRLAGRPTRANFRTGHLTVCTLVPMRSVPHRVVCLLGLDDGAFPRRAPRDGDDLMLTEPLIGERDPRSEDRQLLLDALMAATERLIVTYTGNDERTNAERPPAVPVGELLDAIDASVRSVDGLMAASDRVVTRHPLQPFDPRNFTAGDILGPRPWSFDTVALAGASALRAGGRSAPPPFLSRPLAPKADAIVELADLVRFLEHPVRAFLRQRLGISLRTSADEVQDALSVELDGLERWAVGQRLLEARLAGIGGRTAALAEIARGTLPPGVLGKPVIDDLYRTVDAIYGEATKAAPGAADDPIDVRVALGDGRLLSGTVSNVIGDVLLTTTFSRVSARHRIATWARLLALSASCPERAFCAATVGRAGGRDDVRTVRIEPMAQDPAERAALATAHLRALVDVYDRGMREPLPLYCITSEAYAAAARAGQDAASSAAREWETQWSFDREDRDPEHQLVLGGVRTFAEIAALDPSVDECGPGWFDESETSRLGRYARRLWDGLLEREQARSR